MILAGAMLSLSQIGNAQITLTSNVQQTGNLYHYDYSVGNNSADTSYYVLAIQGLTGADTAFDLIAPTGFKIDYDPGFGLITFLADSQSFDPLTTISGFSFDSYLAPKATTFEATGLTMNGNGVITQGATPGPVPEPSAGVFMVAGLVGTVFMVRRRHRSGVLRSI